MSTEQTAKTILFNLIQNNLDSFDSQSRISTIYDIFAALIQYPCILIRYRIFRTVVYMKLHEFQHQVIPLHLISIFDEVKELLETIKHNPNYID